MVKTLRASGALWTHVNSEKQNARDLAVSGGHDEIVEYFDQGQDMPEDSVLHKVEDDQDEHDEEHDDHEDVLDDEEHQAPAIIAQPVVADTEAEAPMEIGGTDLEVDMQELQDRCDIIAMHATLAHFDRDATMVIAKSCILRHYRRNDVILAPEANSAMRTSLYFVLSGEVRVQKLANDRHDVLLEEGDTYGDMALLLGTFRCALSLGLSRGVSKSRQVLLRVRTHALDTPSCNFTISPTNGHAHQVKTKEM
jgi:hypothetical protein